MLSTSIAHMKDWLHAQFCYQFFITPIHLPIEKQYRHFAKLACELLEGKRTEVIHESFPRHHVLHHFIPQKNIKKKKVLIAHGWMSRAAYMMSLIHFLYQEGYEIYALDFPAHGEAKGIQLPWMDAVAILKKTLNDHGPFYGVVGHSFGGSMLLNTLNIAGQFPEWEVAAPERAVLIASPTQMRGPLTHLAKKLKLSGHGYLNFRQVLQHQAKMKLSHIRLQHFIAKAPNIPFLCVHGELDQTVHPNESILFCKKYQNAHLHLLDKADHVSVLMDERVEHAIYNFFQTEKTALL